MFVIPANTPIAVQPLDSEGKALQLMRSWFTGMPGETLSCIGCHEDKNRVPLPKVNIASRKKPQTLRNGTVKNGALALRMKFNLSWTGLVLPVTMNPVHN
jgi:hypothetical protein